VICIRIYGVRSPITSAVRGQDWRGKLRNRVDIDERPEIVARRARIGDWELDTVVSKGRQRYLMTLIERQSRFKLFKQVESKRATVVCEATAELLEPYQNQMQIITFDNGKEFAEHELVAKVLQTETYFAHPYVSWERGTNGLLRQYFPKDSDFSEATDARVAWVHERLNTRPRKCLNFDTPETVFREAVETCT
jgi:IS30 family transposase